MGKGETSMNITGRNSGRGILNPWALCFMTLVISLCVDIRRAGWRSNP